MVRSFRLVLKLVLLSGAVALVPVGYRAMRGYLREDAFASYKKPASTTPIGIRLEDVRFRHFSGSKLLTYAHADRIDVSRDRYRIEMAGIRDGLYKDGERNFRYQAKYAVWNVGSRVLDVKGGVRIRNAKLDLDTLAAKFEAKKKLITAKGEVKGSILKGKFLAKNLIYNIDTEHYKLGPVEWTGTPPKELVQDAPIPVQRQWNFRAEFSQNDPKNPRIVTHTKAVATDGEVIVIAPKIVHNQDTDEFIASGTEQERIQYFSAKANMVASRVQVFRKERRSIFTGSVVMLVKPKKEQKEKPVVEAMPAFQPLLPDQVKPQRVAPKTPEDRKKGEQLRETKTVRDYPLVMNAAKIEYWYTRGGRRAVITGDPQGRQEMNDGRWRHLWTNVAYYDGEKEMLRMVSTKGRKDTRMKNSIGDDAIADWMLLSTKEDDETFSGAGIEGDFADLSDEDPRGTTKAEPPANQNPPPPTANAQNASDFARALARQGTGRKPR